MRTLPFVPFSNPLVPQFIPAVRAELRRPAVRHRGEAVPTVRAELRPRCGRRARSDGLPGSRCLLPATCCLLRRLLRLLAQRAGDLAAEAEADPRAERVPGAAGIVRRVAD